MAQFKYTLPSGAQFQLDAPNGTTQAQADAIFYGQVAAGTFVGYKVGDTLTHPQEALTNFGLSRLERGTAGVDEKTLVAITAGLPVVTALPTTVSTAPLENPIDQASYILVTSNPATGLVDQGPGSIGSLDRPQVQSLMATSVVQGVNVLSMLGVGKYGFNGPQLIRAGYIKAQLEAECAVDPITQANPPDFIQFMNSPTPWTGKDGVISVNDILNNEALQNRIQELLMNQSYDTLVDTGIIQPPKAEITQPVAQVGQVYDPTGVMVATPAIALLTSAPSASVATASTAIGAASPAVTALGPTASAIMEAGQASLSTGAINVAAGAQLSGLAAGATTGSAFEAATAIAASVAGDIGALITTASKFGPALTTAWAGSTDLLTKIKTTDFEALAKTGITNVGNAAKDALTNLAGSAQAQLKAAIAGPAGAAMALLGKASQFATSLGSQLTGLVSRVEKAAAFTNTVDRKTVDAAVTRVIGSAKVSSPTYEIPSLESLGIAADIDKAKSVLAEAGASVQSLSNQATALVGEAKSAVAQAQTTANGLASQAKGFGKNLFG